ncbi:MAG: DGQHR domain-containing protein [Alphaproteobacteria bacterium]|nr:DGQHR domain-containing protein [Alphaproteobacteria bacterium]
MKLPVIRGRIGNWIYYTGNMTFKEIEENVTTSIEELFTANCLDELLQRSLTDNYISIKNYLLNESERFFNAIILAIYDGDPQWLEVAFKGEESDYNNVGFLEFNGNEVIFPVDGQHRVAGIKHAVEENPELRKESVPVVFIAHSCTEDGRRKTRKLFSTLNRRAKPVGENENIALDEDDVSSIITRELIQSNPLFGGDRLIISKGKQIPKTNKEAFTSLITLYQCVEAIVKWYVRKEKIMKKSYKEFKLYRPEEKDIVKIREKVNEFFSAFSENTREIKQYLNKSGTGKAEAFRNDSGGNLLFRPIALTEYFNAAISLVDSGVSVEEAFKKLNKTPKNISESPWKGFLWDGSKMIGRVNRTAIYLIVLNAVNHNLLTQRENEKMIEVYSSSMQISKDNAKNILNNIRV